MEGEEGQSPRAELWVSSLRGGKERVKKWQVNQRNL